MFSIANLMVFQPFICTHTLMFGKYTLYFPPPGVFFLGGGGVGDKTGKAQVHGKHTGTLPI